MLYDNVVSLCFGIILSWIINDIPSKEQMEDIKEPSRKENEVQTEQNDNANAITKQ